MTARKKKPAVSRADPFAERIARQETITEGLTSDVTDIKKKLEEIQTVLTKYQGFWGGLTLIAAAVVTFLTIFWDSISGKLGWK